MTPKEWAMTWKKAGVALDKVWLREVQEINTENAITSLDSAFKIAMGSSTLRTSSGLVEMQRIFYKKLK